MLSGAHLIKEKTDRNEFHILMRSRNFWFRWAAPRWKLRRFYRQISEVEETSCSRSPARLCTRVPDIQQEREGERERERESWFYVSRFNMEGIVIPRMQWRLSDELACVSTTKTSFDDPPAFIPASLTASMLFLANFWLHNFPLNAKIAWMRSCQDMYKIAWW